MKRAGLAAFAAVLAGTALAHPAPNSLVKLEFEPAAVQAEYWIPVSELGYARAADPGGDFAVYLLRHVAAQSSTGAHWRVTIGKVREARYLDQPYLVAELRLAPPAGAAAREFVLLDDAVTHEVRNHRVYVVARHGADTDLLGMLQYPARRLAITAP